VCISILCSFPYCHFLTVQQDQVGGHDSTAEMETAILGEAQDSYNELHVEEMESQDLSPNKTE
jgi:hypothetical protein